MLIFYCEELLASLPTPELEDDPWSAVRHCLFSVFAATLHFRGGFLCPQPEGAPCCRDVDPLNMVKIDLLLNIQKMFRTNLSARL
jgi:hypothetical protein